MDLKKVNSYEIYVIEVSWHIPFGTSGHYLWKNVYFTNYNAAEDSLDACKADVVNKLGYKPQNISYFKFNISTLNRMVNETEAGALTAERVG